MKDTTVISLAGFFRAVERIVKEWAPQREIDPWFRGQGKDWELIPSIYRPEYQGIRESQLRKDFKLRAWPYLSNRFRIPGDDDDLEWLFLMQHYGIPTRLLDWTQNALLALYFAVEQAIDESKQQKQKKITQDAVVWVLNPSEFNRIAEPKRS